MERLRSARDSRSRCPNVDQWHSAGGLAVLQRLDKIASMSSAALVGKTLFIDWQVKITHIRIHLVSDRLSKAPTLQLLL